MTTLNRLLLTLGITFTSLLFSVSMSFASGSKTNFDTAYYPTPEAAVIAAANRYNPISIQQDREFMGMILRQNDGYRYTVVRGDIGADTVSIKLTNDDWSKLVAFWHTHGKAAHGYQYFSDLDTALANLYQKPFYLADYTGRLKVFKPGDRTMSSFRASRLGLPSNSGYATGVKVRDVDNKQVTINTRLTAPRAG